MAMQKNLPGNRPDDVPEDEERRQRRWDRRTFIRTGLAVGAGVVASAYVKPSLQSIGIPRSFAQVTPTGTHPSIEFRRISEPPFPDGPGDDFEETEPGTATSHTFLNVELCNVSGHLLTAISDWLFVVNPDILNGGLLDGGAAGVVLPDAEDFPTLTSADTPDCERFPVTFNLDPTPWQNAELGTQIKVGIDAFGSVSGNTAVTHLTLTLVKVPTP